MCDDIEIDEIIIRLNKDEIIMPYGGQFLHSNSSMLQQGGFRGGRGGRAPILSVAQITF